MSQLIGKVCLVTGATRGIGKGIALQLAENGAIVYITGRTVKKSTGDAGSLEETAAEITAHGGMCIPVECDHSKEDDVRRLFLRIKSEQNGRLDVLVNNAYSAVKSIMKYGKVPFWEQPVSMWDEVNNVGLRNHYICAVLAAQLMVPRRAGVIVNVSSPGGLRYVFNTAYGIGKAACDRMAADCAVELRKHNVAFVSLWPNAVFTEITNDFIKTPRGQHFKRLLDSGGETPEYVGKAVVHLVTDPGIMKKSGRILMTSDLAGEYGFTDADGRSPVSFRSVSYLIYHSYPTMARFIPRWIKVPGWMLALYSSKL